MATVVDDMSLCAFREHPKQVQLHYRRPFTEYPNSKKLQYRKAFKPRINSCWSQRSISGGKRVEEIVKQAKEMMRKSGQCDPPRWFTPLDCGEPPPNAPLLLYLPGIDGTGLGMASHHQSLGELFEVRCLHIPSMDRTSFEGILTFVEETLKREFRCAPSRPIYLVGESLGGSLGLALAANNPDIDLVPVLVNPATWFSKSPLRPWFSLMEILTEEFYSIIPFTQETLWVLLDFNDLKKIPFYTEYIERSNKDIPNVRSEASGEVANQQMYFPIMAPKPPGRLYFLFGKPMPTIGRKDELQDKLNAHNFYLQVKGEVEATMEYLLQKREKDPYRHFLPRFLYEAASGFTHQMPTFDP